MAREVNCHAVNLFFEARGEPSLGQRWVLDVVMNRVKSKELFRRSTVCGIVTQYKQFSWYLEHRQFMPSDPLLWEEYIHRLYSHDVTEMAAWERSFQISMIHYLYLHSSDVSKGSDYFMTIEQFIKRGYKPFPGTRIVEVIGNHIFFKSIQGG